MVCSSDIAQLHDQPLCFCAWDKFFSAAATKEWAWCNNAELVERAAALRNILLVGSGCFDIPRGMTEMNSRNKHVLQISFQQCITFCEHPQLNCWQPRFQTTVAKSLDCRSHPEAQSVHCHTSWRRQLDDQPLCFCAWDKFFSAAATKEWAWCNNAELVEHAAALRNLLLVGSGCFDIPRGMTGMNSWNKHVLQISFGTASHFAIMGSWKACSPASNPLMQKAHSWQLFIGLQ